MSEPIQPSEGERRGREEVARALESMAARVRAGLVAKFTVRWDGGAVVEIDNLVTIPATPEHVEMKP